MYYDAEIAQKKMAAQPQYNPTQLGNSAINHGMHLPALHMLTSRITQLTDGLREIGFKLREHADALHGACPETAGIGCATPRRDGALGCLEDAIDELGRVQGMVGEQAGRNCTLA